MGVDHLRIDRDGPPDLARRAIQLPLRAHGNPQQVKGVGMVGLMHQGQPVERRGPGHVP